MWKYDQISGAELLLSAFERITIAQHEIGDQVVLALRILRGTVPLTLVEKIKNV